MPKFSLSVDGPGGELLPGEEIDGATNPMAQVEVAEADRDTKVLRAGQIGFCRPAAGGVQVRIGDGTTVFSGLPDPVASGATATWGGITGTLASQTDINAALAGKASSSHTHAYVAGDREVNTFGLLRGGGDLGANLTISLAGDTGDTPGTSLYYGTNGAGVVGLFPLPAGGNGSGIDGVDDVLTRVGESVTVIAIASAAPVTPAWADGNWQRYTLGANISALNRPGLVADAVASSAYTITFEFVQDATGGRSVTINGTPGSNGFNVVGGVPVVGTQPGEITTLVAWTLDGGASWYLQGTNMATNVGFDGAAIGVADATVQLALARALNGAVTVGDGLSGSFSVKAGGTLAADFAGTGSAATVARSDHTHTALLPTGGALGQVLKKASGTNYDAAWADESGGGGTVVGARDIFGGDFAATFDGPHSVNGGDFAATFS